MFVLTCVCLYVLELSFKGMNVDLTLVFYFFISY